MSFEVPHVPSNQAKEWRVHILKYFSLPSCTYLFTEAQYILTDRLLYVRHYALGRHSRDQQGINLSLRDSWSSSENNKSWMMVQIHAGHWENSEGGFGQEWNLDSSTEKLKGQGRGTYRDRSREGQCLKQRPLHAKQRVLKEFYALGKSK